MPSTHAQLQELYLTGDETNMLLAEQLAEGLFGGVQHWDFYARWQRLTLFYRTVLQKPHINTADLIRYMRTIGISLDKPLWTESALPDEFSVCASIVRRINLQEFTHLADLGEGFRDYSEVEELSIRHCPIVRLPDYLWGWHRLKKLEILSSEITQLPAAIANLRQLETLKLSSYNYISLHEDLALLPRLQHLHYDVWDVVDAQSGSKQTLFPTVIFQLPHLQTLHLNGGFKLSIPPATRLPNLQKLYCFEFNDDDFPADFADLSALTDVYICSSKTLDSLPDFLFDLPNLRHLYLENIPLSPIDFYPSIQRLPHLRQLTYKQAYDFNSPEARRFKTLWARTYPRIQLQWLRF